MTSPTRASLEPAGLRCAHLIDPLGVAPDRVRFGWRLEGTGTDRAQRAYQVLVAPDEQMLSTGDELWWDTGQVESAQSASIAYAGRPLAAGSCYAWKVRVWDESGSVSDWSATARFEVELDQASGWQASWIGLGHLRQKVTPPAQAGMIR